MNHNREKTPTIRWPPCDQALWEQWEEQEETSGKTRHRGQHLEVSVHPGIFGIQTRAARDRTTNLSAWKLEENQQTPALPPELRRLIKTTSLMLCHLMPLQYIWLVGDGNRALWNASWSGCQHYLVAQVETDGICINHKTACQHLFL